MVPPMMIRRRINRRRRNNRRSWPVRLLSDVWHVGPSFLYTLIVWFITFYKSVSSGDKSWQAQRAYNPLCAGSSPCLHIGIPLFTNLGLYILSIYMVCKIAIIMIQLLDCEGVNIPRSARVKMFKDWYKWAILTIVVLVLIVLELFDNAAPWVSVVYAVSGACLVVGYYILMKNRWTAIVAEDRYEQQPAQELNSWSARAWI